MMCHRTGVPIACRGHARAARAKCMIGGCRRQHSHQCDFPLVDGTKCGAKLCTLHVFTQADGRDFCPYHQRQATGA